MTAQPRAETLLLPWPVPVPVPVTAVVPVKPLGIAKSRLGVAREVRRDLALAFAVDTVDALSDSPFVDGVVVVTSDEEVAEHLRRPSVRLAPDPGSGLVPAVGAGARVASSGPHGGLLVVPADLPCLRAGDVAEVLHAAAAPLGRGRGCFVPDRAGTGTTLVLYPPGRPAVSRYGPGSATAHQGLGLARLDGLSPRVRQDVDTLDDLAAALALGVGPRTQLAVRGLVAELSPPRPPSR